MSEKVKVFRKGREIQFWKRLGKEVAGEASLSQPHYRP
jgi:hypothetical protein